MTKDAITALQPTVQSHRMLTQVMVHPRGHCIGVLGLGVTGTAMALYLARRGARIRAVDARVDIVPLPEAVLRELPIVVRLGAVPATIFADCDAVAISPGVSPAHPAVVAAMQASKPVFGELELQVPLPAPCIAISGTNGKSTTTTLVGMLLRALGKQTFVGGNLGDPIAGWLDSQVPTDVAVLELSSYQLDCAYRFAPEIAVMLNVSPDHLTRYGTFDAYLASKARLVAAVPPTGHVILNFDDAQVRAMAACARAKTRWFSTQQQALPEGFDGVTLVRDRWVPQGVLHDLPIFDLAHPRLLGVHNKENAMAALLAVLTLLPRSSQAPLQAAYTAFTGLEHRLEVVGELEDVCYINDSKATNDASAATAVRAMQRPVILLVGGLDKGGGYARLGQACMQRDIRHIVAFGAAAERIVAALAAVEAVKVCVPNLEQALVTARHLAQPGDVVLMAPACASFDAFADYRQRGDVFKNWLQRQKSVS